MFSLNRILLLAVALFLSISAIAKPLVTFVCTGNTGRSPMAESLAKKYITDKHLNIAVESRGVGVNMQGRSPESGTVTVLRERGIDISSHQAQQLTAKDMMKSKYVLTMTQSHKDKILKLYPQSKNKVFTLAEFSIGKHEDVSDPYQLPLAAYRKVEQQLDVFIPLALNKISKQNE